MNGQTIWKFPIEVNDRFYVQMPRRARILCVQVQQGRPFIWARVDPGSPLVDHEFALYGTGHPPCGHDGLYVGTFQLHGGALVFHLFDCGHVVRPASTP